MPTIIKNINSDDCATAPPITAGGLTSLATALIQPGTDCCQTNVIAPGGGMSIDVGEVNGFVQYTSTLVTPNELVTSSFCTTGNTSLPIAGADPANPRIDIVVIEMDGGSTPNATGSNVGTLNVISGSPAANPVAPTAPANSTVIAEVFVAAGTTAITSGNISFSCAQLNGCALGDCIVQPGLIENFSVDTGSLNTFITQNDCIETLEQGTEITFLSNNVNIAPATLELNGFGAIPIRKCGGSEELEINDIVAGMPVKVTYNGAEWVMMTPTCGADSCPCEYGDGTDGILAGSITLDQNNIYNYAGINLPVGNTIDVANQNQVQVVRVLGDMTVSGTIDVDGMGGAGGVGATAVGQAGGSGQSGVNVVGGQSNGGGEGGQPPNPTGSNIFSGAGGGGSSSCNNGTAGSTNVVVLGGGNQPGAFGGGGVSNPVLSGSPFGDASTGGGGGAGGATFQTNAANNSPSGGNGGGSIIFWICGDLTFEASASISARGEDGEDWINFASAADMLAGGGGGGGQVVFITQGNFTDNGATMNLNGGTGGQPNCTLNGTSCDTADGGDGCVTVYETCSGNITQY